MENLENKLTEVLADPHVHEVLSAWFSMRASGALAGVLAEKGGLDSVIQSLNYRGRYNELIELTFAIKDFHEKGQKQLKNQ